MQKVFVIRDSIVPLLGRDDGWQWHGRITTKGKRNMTNEIPNDSTAGSGVPVWCFDTEDVEGWLVEEGIGHFDRSGMFHYGPGPDEENSFDIPVIADFGERPYN
jgi:hypothetical protein